MESITIHIATLECENDNVLRLSIQVQPDGSFKFLLFAIDRNGLRSGMLYQFDPAEWARFKQLIEAGDLVAAHYITPDDPHPRT